MRLWVLLAATLLLLSPLTTVQAAPTPPPNVPRFAKFEASWTLANQTGNPFDPADNDVEVTFTRPKAAPVTVPAFWDGARWRVRYAPLTVGLYRLSVTRNGKAATPADLAPKTFRCVPSNRAGFVRRDPKIVQRFVFDTGATYYPLGMNVPWTGKEVPAFGPAFAQMHTDNLNWARVWMTYWDGRALDWAQDKTKNPKQGYLLMDAAEKWDTILDAADKTGVYVQMTLQHHGQYTEKVNPNWQDNPWNVANGGFLAHPDDFFTDARAKHLTKLKYRYILARYGYSTHIMAWELFNEVQNIKETDSHFGDVVAWHKEMLAFLRAGDVNHHLVTTSFSAPGTPLAEIGMDFDQPHEYTSDIISYFASQRGANVPLFTGEWGPADFKTGLTEDFVHDGLWASLMSPVAGAGQFWAASDIVTNNWWPQFGSAGNFVNLMHIETLPVGAVLTPKVSADGPRGPLSFAPSGWGNFTRDRILLPSSGAAPDLSGLAGFFQGENHRDMMPKPITFVLDCAAPSEFQLQLGTIAKAGAHPVLTVDGVRTADKDFPASDTDHDAGQTLTVAVPAGHHEVSVFNEGQDWFVLKNITVADYAPPVAALARGGGQSAVFWVYARSRTASIPSGAALTLPGMTAGRCTVRLWDTWTGRALPPMQAVSRGGSVTITLPAFSRDLAGVVTSVK